jgi:DNA-binding GntR family transcriptional regulator
MPNRPLDRNSFEPLYYQLAEKIKVMIQQQFTPGDLLPSESELMARYTVSRNTVRQAIEILDTSRALCSRAAARAPLWPRRATATSCTT